MAWEIIKSRQQRQLEQAHRKLIGSGQGYGTPPVDEVRRQLLDLRAREVSTNIKGLTGESLTVVPSLMAYPQDHLNCHVNVIMDIIHITFDRQLGDMFLDNPQGNLLRSSHEARKRGVNMRSLSALNRTFICGLEEDDLCALTQGHGRLGYNGTVHGPLLMVYFNRLGAQFTKKDKVSFQLEDREKSLRRTIDGCMNINGALSADGAVSGYLKHWMRAGEELIGAPQLLFLECDTHSKTQLGVFSPGFIVDLEISVASHDYELIAITLGNGHHFIQYHLRVTTEGKEWFLADDLTSLRPVPPPTTDIIEQFSSGISYDSASTSAARIYSGYGPVNLIYAQSTEDSSEANSQVL